MREIPHENVMEALASIEYGTGLVLNAGDLGLLLIGQDDLVDEISAGYSSDTSVREQLADLVMLALIGRRWPTYDEARRMGEEEHEKLFASAREAALARHWHIKEAS